MGGSFSFLPENIHRHSAVRDSLMSFWGFAFVRLGDEAGFGVTINTLWGLWSMDRSCPEVRLPRAEPMGVLSKTLGGQENNDR